MHLHKVVAVVLLLCCFLHFVNADKKDKPNRKALHKKNYKEKKKEVEKAIKEHGKSWKADTNPDFDDVDDFGILLGGEQVSEKSKPNRSPPALRKRPTKGAKNGPNGGQKDDPNDVPPPDDNGNHPPEEDPCKPVQKSTSTRSPSKDAGMAKTRRKRMAPLPEFYDARLVYPDCPSMGSIRYQYHCSSCWAVTCTSVISDRHCIYNANITGQLYFSTTHVIACIPKGCDGGKEWEAYDYWINNGLVTGGTEYVPANQPLGCLPYPKGINATPPTCPTTCASTPQQGNVTFKGDIIKGGTWYNWWSPPVALIQEEIYTYGPVAAFFPCYEDLFYYKSGTYEHVYGEIIGYHLTKLVGWGTDENGTDYWQAINTWGVKWGENGTFKIRRGVNEVGIEERMSTVLPKEGCEGGQEWDAYEYWVQNGLVTGGTEYAPAKQPLGCLPYPKGINATPPKRPTSCTTSLEDNITFQGGTWYNWWSPAVAQIQEEIYNYGPVAAFFTCYEDFYYYKSGVYEHVDGKLIACHLAKLVG